MISIDQNSHSLWDVIPKLHALAAGGRQVRHYVEDIDVAFTCLGCHAQGQGPGLALARERYHRSGGQDWGAALFYCEFLGRLPVEVRDWEPFTGMSTKALAKELSLGVDDLYDQFSPGDNWQLIGSSYIGDQQHHRVIGDLTVAETAGFLRQVMDRARQDCLLRFPQAASRKRTEEWFAQEQARMEGLIDRCAGGRLVDLYRAWLEQYLPPTAQVALTSSLPCLHGGSGMELLEAFLADYAGAAGLYNQALAETRTGQHPLQTDQGELPFFAVMDHHGHLVRAACRLDGADLRICERGFPLAPGRRLPMDALAAAGVRCLAGKAILLVIQVRLAPQGQPLALPHWGSVYMPAAHRLADKLAEAGMLSAPLEPVIRVRFRLLDRLAGCKTVIRLPEHLASAFGQEEIAAERLAEGWQVLAQQAGRRLEDFRAEPDRRQWQEDAFPDIHRRMVELEAARRRQAQHDPKAPEIRELWRQHKALKIQVLAGTVRQIARDWQVSRIDYWDSRGALLPWGLALGGKDFYDRLVGQAEIYEERGQPARE